MKKGYFFMLDSFIAMSIILFSLILIFSFHTSKPYQMQGIFIADDIMDVFAGTRVEEIDNDFIYGLYTGSTNITNPKNSLAEQVAEFLITDREGLAQQFVKNITVRMVPEKYGFMIRVYNETKAWQFNISEGSVSQDEAKLIVSSKKILTGNINRTYYWGPMMAEVRIWQ
ncbi:MAG: hypothetical protein ABIG95_06710 [Candidatus Woesearchaeota archaeon]